MSAYLSKFLAGVGVSKPFSEPLVNEQSLSMVFSSGRPTNVGRETHIITVCLNSLRADNNVALPFEGFCVWRVNNPMAADYIDVGEV